MGDWVRVDEARKSATRGSREDASSADEGVRLTQKYRGNQAPEKVGTNADSAGLEARATTILQRCNQCHTVTCERAYS